MTNVEHIHPDFRHILGLPARERIDFLLQPRWIGYSAAGEAMNRMQRLLTMPPQSRMENILLVGDSNNGKTTIINRFKELHGEGYVNEFAEPVKPVVVVEAPPRASEKELYIAILEEFRAPFKASQAVAELRHRVEHMCRLCHVRLIIIDEFHSMLVGTVRQQREVLNALKSLCNRLLVPIVAVGTPDATALVSIDRQHASRFEVLKLPLWPRGKEFRLLLKGFESVLPLKEPSMLYKDAELLELIYDLSGANLGNVTRLLRRLAEEAIRSGVEQITTDLVQSRQWRSSLAVADRQV